jgi:hypothetical protein
MEGAVQDWGYFLLLAWPVVIPWYAFKTRGRSGWRLTAGLLGSILPAYISWIFVAHVMWYFEAGAQQRLRAAINPRRLKGTVT